MADSASPAKASADKGKKNGDAPRNAIKNPLVWGFSFVLLVIIVIAFVVAPIYSPIAADSQKLVFGSYGGSEIAYKNGNYFAGQYDMYKSQNEASGTDNFQAEYSALRAAFDRTVLHMAILDLGKNLGVSATNEKVDQTVAESPIFLDNGKFSMERFAKVNEMEKRSMRQLAREDLVHQRILGDLIDGTLASDKETAFIKDVGRSVRSFEMIGFLDANYPDDQVASYAEKNAKIFNSIDLSVITVDTKDAAEKIRKQIADKAITFEDAAKNSSTDMYKSSSGVRGAVSYHELKLEVSDAAAVDAVFALEKGAMSNVVTLPVGFALYRADSALRPFNPQDTEAMKQVRSYLLANEKGTIEAYLSAQARDFVTQARADGFDKATKAAKLTVELTNSFPINYGGITLPTMYGNYPVLADPATAAGAPIGNAASNEAFFQAAFSLKDGEISDPIVLNDRIVVLKLKEAKQLDDAGLGLFTAFAGSIARQFLSTDLEGRLIDRTKLVDNFDQTFIAHYMPRQ